MTAIATQARLTLHADLAGDMMVSNPVSIRQDASVNDAILLFTRKGFSVAPVIDAAGRPIGVVSRSDIMIHERTIAQGDNANALVRDLMAPAVFSVSPHTTPCDGHSRNVGPEWGPCPLSDQAAALQVA